MKRCVPLLLAVLATLTPLPAGQAPPAARTGPWLGETPPGETPVLFAPGVVSTGLYERDVAVTPDGREFYFGILGNDFAVIAVCRQVDGRWTGPELAPFSRDPKCLNLEPCVAPDGKRLLFLSTRARAGQEQKPGWADQDIWAMDRTAGGWGEPYNLGAPVNSDRPEFFPSLTRDGTLYFTREEADKRSAIYRSRRVNGTYAEPERLPGAVNGGPNLFNACIAPDESYLVVCIGDRPDNLGRADYYVCFRTPDDRWSAPVNLGPAVNGKGDAATSPAVTPDGRFFFFGSSRRVPAPAGEARTYRALQEERVRPGNGNCDVYWVSTALIEKLRPKP
ncbi:MAG: PD40 domain-containing protein [Acidobacteria bacterium]|nr:PD40 domain-containing protein [Acidobacteriota bacterium]